MMIISSCQSDSITRNKEFGRLLFLVLLTIRKMFETCHLCVLDHCRIIPSTFSSCFSALFRTYVQKSCWRQRSAILFLQRMWLGFSNFVTKSIFPFLLNNNTRSYFCDNNLAFITWEYRSSLSYNEAVRSILSSPHFSSEGLSTSQSEIHSFFSINK